VLVIVIAIVYDLFIKRWVTAAYDRSIFSSRQKRIAGIINEFNEVKKYRENLPLLIADTLQLFILIILATVGEIGLVGVIIINTLILPDPPTSPIYKWVSYSYFVSGILLFVVGSIYIGWIAYNRITRVVVESAFNKYRGKVIKKLERLGFDLTKTPGGLADG
jgi:hypothetical protein